MMVNSIWFVGLTVLQMMPVYAEYADKLVTLRSSFHCLNIFRNEPKNFAAFPSRPENQPIPLCPNQGGRIPRGKIWITFGFDRTDWPSLPWAGKPQWQSTYEIPAGTDEIIFNSEYCITELSKEMPGLAGNVICPSCSQRDVTPKGAPTESNPYVVSEYTDIVPDPVGLASRCNSKVGTPESSPPAGTDTAPSSDSSSLEQFNLHIDTEQPPAAAPATNHLHPYVDPLKSESKV